MDSPVSRKSTADQSALICTAHAGKLFLAPGRKLHVIAPCALVTRAFENEMLQRMDLRSAANKRTAPSRNFVPHGYACLRADCPYAHTHAQTCVLDPSSPHFAITLGPLREIRALPPSQFTRSASDRLVTAAGNSHSPASYVRHERSELLVDMNGLVSQREGVAQRTRR